MPPRGTSKVEEIIEELEAGEEAWMGNAASMIADSHIPAEPLAQLLRETGRDVSASSIRTYRRNMALKDQLQEKA